MEVWATDIAAKATTNSARNVKRRMWDLLVVLREKLYSREGRLGVGVLAGNTFDFPKKEARVGLSASIRR
jgi:hypothetical protein